MMFLLCLIKKMNFLIYLIILMKILMKDMLVCLNILVIMKVNLKII